MMQFARNVAMNAWRFLDDCRYLLHDRDTKYTQSFRQIIKSSSVAPLRLPLRTPNLNAYAERWVRSVKGECLSYLVFLGEASLRSAVRKYLVHHHTKRNQRDKENVLLFPTVAPDTCTVKGSIACRQRFGGRPSTTIKRPQELLDQTGMPSLATLECVQAARRSGLSH